jgi:hypothetical protein
VNGLTTQRVASLSALTSRPKCILNGASARGASWPGTLASPWQWLCGVQLKWQSFEAARALVMNDN